MDRLDELEALVAVLDTGSLAAAGRRLRRSPPAMTRLLTALEARMGARLVERTTRSLAPTDAGRRLADQARAVLAGYASAVRDADDSPLRGTVRATAPVVFGRLHVTPLVLAFLDAHPGVQVNLTLADRNLDLIEDGLDAAVRIGELADSGLVARRVGEVRRMLVASPAYVAARGTPGAPGDLAGHDAIFFSGRPVPVEWRFHDGAAAPSGALATTAAGQRGRSGACGRTRRAGPGDGAVLTGRSRLGIRRPGALAAGIRAAAAAGAGRHPGGRHMAPRVRAFLDHAARCLLALDVIRPGRSWNAGTAPYSATLTCRSQSCRL